MRFKYGRYYKHESGTVAMVVGKIKGIVVKKGLLLELNAPGQRTIFQPAGVEEKHAKGWHEITRGEFIAASDMMNRDLIEKHKTAIKEDNCMRDVVETAPQDDCLAIMLECSHIVKFDKGDKAPKVGSKMHCTECQGQNEAIAKQLGATKKPDLKVVK